MIETLPSHTGEQQAGIRRTNKRAKLGQARQSMRSKESSAGVVRWQNLTKTEQESNLITIRSNQHNPLPRHDLTANDNTRHLAAPGV